MTPNTHPPTIIGAGLAGLIAAHAWPSARLFEAAPEPAQQHKALLRFRTDAVSRLTGIPFRKVRVRKGIWHDGAFRQPTLQLANWYSWKCLGRLLPERSIWAVEPVDRYIAPEDFYASLLDSVGPRISWGTTVALGSEDGSPQISTAPLPVALSSLTGVATDLKFDRSPIRVERFDLGAAVDVYQTVYFPDPRLAVYRASITGRTLILESVAEGAHPREERCRREIYAAFGLLDAVLEPMDAVRQQYGKIAPIGDDQRKHLLFRLTHERNIYSLGRFATWRNILLDDVVSDIDVIKRLMRSGQYELRRST